MKTQHLFPFVSWLLTLLLITTGNTFLFGQEYDYQNPFCVLADKVTDAPAPTQNGPGVTYPITLSIGVLLAEFDTRPHSSNNYKVEDFENLLFSDDYYVTDNPVSVKSPDGEKVYGSLKDWFQENSHGWVQITGNVINPDNNGIPVWLNMGNYANYNSTGETRDLLVASINRAAIDSSWNCNYNIICVIGSGDGYPSVTWFGSPNFGTVTSTYLRINRSELPADTTSRFDYDVFWGGYTTGERWKGDLASQSNTFEHVAPHAHEAFHVIGQGLEGRWYDQNLGLSPLGDWCVMHRLGIGPLRKGACPSHLDAARKVSVGWATPTEITANNMQETITYVETQVDNATFDFYRFTDPATGEEFVIENRQYSGFNRFMPAWWESGTPLGGFLVFNARGGVLPNFNDVTNITIVSADNVFTTNYNQANDPNQWSVGDPGDPFPGTSTNTSFTPYTTPNTNNRSGGQTEFAITNISNSTNNMTATFHVDYVVPAAPQNFFITNRGSNGQNPIMQWDANTETDLDHYAIYRGYQDSKTDPINWPSTPSGTTSNTTWTDPFVTISSSAGSRVNYRVTAVDDASNESGYSNSDYVNSFSVPKAYHEDTETTVALPTQFRMHTNYPNPFNPETQIQFDLPEATQVRLTIYNIAGAEVQTLTNSFLPAGSHNVTWNGKDMLGAEVASGVYIYRLKMQQPASTPNNLTFTKKMMLLR